MQRLGIKDIINNAKDELDRAYELLKDNEDAIDDMLVSDIESSLDRLEDINERIEFALILAVYAGYKCAELDYEYDCDNAEWREKYLHIASDVELEYDGDYVDSELAYITATELVNKLFE